MKNLISHEKAEAFLWIYINDYLAGKIDRPEANALIAAMFNDASKVEASYSIDLFVDDFQKAIQNSDETPGAYNQLNAGVTSGAFFARLLGRQILNGKPGSEYYSLYFNNSPELVIEHLQKLGINFELKTSFISH